MGEMRQCNVPVESLPVVQMTLFVDIESWNTGERWFPLHLAGSTNLLLVGQSFDEDSKNAHEPNIAKQHVEYKVVKQNDGMT